MSISRGLPIALAGLALFQPTGSSAEAISFKEATKEVMITALSAMREMDFATALQNFERAQAIVDAAKNAPETTENRQARTAIPFLIGKTKAEGKLGDPCPSFAKARVEMDKLLSKFEKSLRQDSFPIDTMITDLDVAQAENGCIKRNAATSAQGLMGRYNLSGVREVASGLHLSEDGRYEWYMSYGAVDQYSTGTWTVAGRDVVLTHVMPAAGTALFKPREMTAWNVDAENQVLGDIHKAQVAAVLKACPFLDEIDVANATFAPPVVEANTQSRTEAPKPEPRAALKKAELEEKQARAAYERTATVAMRAGRVADVHHGDARLARYEWQSAFNVLLQARRAAELPLATLDQPMLPKLCNLPEEMRAPDVQETQWKRGIAVLVGDPELDLNFQNVDVTFHLVDGTRVERKTNRRGFAWVEKRAGQNLSAISLNYRGAGRVDAKPERFTIPDVAEGVLPVEIQSRQFTAPPFDVMRLTISGKEQFRGPRGRGTYSKQ